MSYSTSFQNKRRVKKIFTEYDLAQNVNQQINPEILDLQNFYRNDLKSFFIDFWAWAGTNSPIKPDISLDAVVEHIYALINKDFKTLIFCMPPRQGKSTLFSVMLEAWLWCRDPSTRILTTCYAKDYAARDNKNMQDLIMSQAYQHVFGSEFKLTTLNQTVTANDKNGKRVATSLQGKNTGEGGTWVVMDDLVNVVDMHSMANLERANHAVSSILISRQNQAADTHFVMAMHRCAHMDTAGAWLARNDGRTCYANIPMEYEIARRTVTVSPFTKKIIWADPRKVEGEVLAPERYPPEELKFIKTHMGNVKYRALYQGHPVMDEASIFKQEWFKIWPYHHEPHYESIIQSWDTAISTNEQSCFSAATNWGVFKDNEGNYNLILLSMWSGRKEWTELRHMAIRLSKNYDDIHFDHPQKNIYKPADYLLIEAKANGGSLIQSLDRAGVKCVKYNPPIRNRRDKVVTQFEDAKAVRARLMAPIVESGRVWVKGEPPHFEHARPVAQNFIRACTSFPSNVNDSRDIVDTFTMTLDHLQRQGKLFTLDDIMHRVG